MRSPPSARAKVWLAGLAVATPLAVALGRDPDRRELAVPVVLLGLSAIALIAEAAVPRSTARGPTRAQPPEGARPADGVVEVLAMTGIESIPNPVGPGWRRFVRMAGDGRPARPLPTRTPRLLGRVCLISVFVGKDGRGWSDSEIVRAHEALGRAGLWVEREAGRLDRPVNVGLAEVYFLARDDRDEPVEVAFHPEGDDFAPMEAEAATKGVAGASRAAALLGFLDVADLMGRINPRVESDATVWLFHLRRSGRSLAIPPADSGVSGVGLAVCFARESSFPEPLVGAGRVDPTTVAHELLHLFGASDKYGVPLRSFPTGMVSSRDIMRLEHESLGRMKIDPLTAWEIGWGRTDRPGGEKTPARAR